MPANFKLIQQKVFDSLAGQVVFDYSGSHEIINYNLCKGGQEVLLAIFDRQYVGLSLLLKITISLPENFKLIRQKMMEPLAGRYSLYIYSGSHKKIN